MKDSYLLIYCIQPRCFQITPTIYLTFFSDENDSIMKSGEALNTLAEEIVELKEKCYQNLKVYICHIKCRYIQYVQEVVTTSWTDINEE